MPLKHENNHDSLFQRAFTVPYNAKKMKKYGGNDPGELSLFSFRLEKEYTVIRKEEQEEQIEIRVWRLKRISFEVMASFYSSRD